MSPLDVPLSLVGIGLAAGSVVGVAAFFAVCALIERTRR